MSVLERAARRATKDLGPEKKVVVFPPAPATNGRHANDDAGHAAATLPKIEAARPLQPITRDGVQLDTFKYTVVGVGTDGSVTVRSDDGKPVTLQPGEFEAYGPGGGDVKLDALAAEWKLAPLAASKKLKVGALLIRAGKDYPLPKSIAVLPKPKAGKPAAAAKAKRGGQ